MKTLLLSGYGISISVDSGYLHVKNGRDHNKEPQEYIFKPKSTEYNGIIIYGHSGNVSLDAFKWLSKMNIQLSILNWDGRVLSNVLIPEQKQSRTRMAQYQAYETGQRIDLAKTFIEAKIQNSICVLDWLCIRYPELLENKGTQLDEVLNYQSKLPLASTVAEIMGIEGMVARNYWHILSSTFDTKLGFEGRAHGKTARPMGAIDPINALFNYGYSLLETQCWKAVNSNGLDPHVGFLHEMAVGSAPLVYDLQEPFRWLVDVAVITCLENRIFDHKDFIRTENYNMRIRPKGVEKLVVELNGAFSNRVPYGKKSWEWGYVITKKANELAQYLIRKRKTLDFSNPQPKLERVDTAELREKILNISYSEWKELGYSKGTLHYLKKNVKSGKPFTIYGKVRRIILDY